MTHVSPLVEEIIVAVHEAEEDVTVDVLDAETARPHSLIEESVERLEGRFLETDNTTLTLTAAGQRIAADSSR